MEKAVFFKEWIKTRRTFAVIAVAGMALALYAVMGVRRIEAVKGVEHVWMIMLLKDQTFVDILKYFPMISGIVLAISQMYPEMHQKRLKLTLHLPYSQNKIVALMLAVGLSELLSVFVIQTAVIGFFYRSIVTAEMSWTVVLTMLPWFIAGLNAYLFVAAVCLEGRWRMRVLLGLLAVATVAVYFKQTATGAYQQLLIPLCLAVIMTIFLVYRSVIRFKEGLQD